MSRVSEPREDPEGLEGRESKMQQCHRGRVGGGGETDRQTESVPPRNGGGGGSIHLLLQRIGLHPWELSSWETSSYQGDSVISLNAGFERDAKECLFQTMSHFQEAPTCASCSWFP